ncbi:hypothetical protein HG537_0D02150 [Torulaspora globosa]|uniref:separase n=1 Tax=Torulaspora globosa TaxID=48254 RepID=A0A7H9HR43_9SACH|nr:hypothetical protein HG537_0D02150 [Torulaspora sp. CBS 2947]
MSKPEEPLNEVSLNTPAKKQAIDPMSLVTKDCFDRCSGENVFKYEVKRSYVSSKYIDHHYGFISENLKRKKPIKSQIDLLHQSFSELYRIFMQIHMWEDLRILTKRHLMVIVGLLNENDVDGAIDEIIHLYNATNDQAVKDLHGILLADFIYPNECYLTSLKLLALQAILRAKSANEHADSIMRFFALDYRYLLRDGNVKIHMVIQLLLNFFTLLPSAKTMLGLKFLQYIKQYNLEFDSYIKNMDELTFQDQLKYYAREMNDNVRMYLTCFYDDYSKYYSTPQKIMLTDFVQQPLKEHTSLPDLIGQSNVKRIQTCFVNYSSRRLIQVISSILKSEDCPMSTTMSLLKQSWEVIRFNGRNEVNGKRILFDKTLSFLNSKISMLKENQIAIRDLLESMAEYCIDDNQFKRMSNLVNVLFNSFVVLKDMDFLKLAARLESRRYMLERESSLLRPTIEKFERFISKATSWQAKLQIFGYLFNLQMAGRTLGKLQNFCQLVYLRCFQKLELTKYIEFRNCSEVMLAYFYGVSPIKEINMEGWCPITQMLYSCISGKFCLGTVDVNPETNKWHFLHKYEVLIKAAYCFNIEMSKHSTFNLASITNNYMNKWVMRKLSSTAEKVTVFEIDFLRTLLIYLQFNNFDKFTIDLIQCLGSRSSIYEPFLLESEGFLLSAYINLQMLDKIAMIRDKIYNTPFDLQNGKLETVLHVLRMKLQLMAWENDHELFDKVFIQEAPKLRKELFDLDNATKKTSSQYIKIILFNIDVLITASALQLVKNNMVRAATESKRALKLSVSILRKLDNLSEKTRLNVVSYLACSYLSLLNLYIHLGVARDCEFYVNELSTLLCDLNEPTIVFKCLQFLYEYYQLTGQTELAATALRKSNNAFDYIDGESNILALTSFFFINNENEKLLDSLGLFFKEEIDETFLPYYWRLKMGIPVGEWTKQSKYKATYELNKLDMLYRRVLKQLESEPFFRSMLESLVIIPSCHLPAELSPKKPLALPGKKALIMGVMASPRSSTMTPRGKHIKQKFDRAVAIDNLKGLKGSVDELELSSLKNHELSRVASFYSLALSLLSNLSITTSLVDNLLDEFALSELPKCLPLYYDKALAAIDNDIYDTFCLLPLSSMDDPVALQRQKSLAAQKRICQNPIPFNVISIDYCSVTGSLLISKIETFSDRKVHLRMPLNRAHTRDLDSKMLSFEQARRELSDIIRESNASTSLEVTSSINTREQRKEWWQTRHELDRRLHELLKNIEDCWFNGMKGFFGAEIVDSELLQDFKDEVNDVLHQNLPSRKQNGNRDMFLQLDDWILELVLRLSPQSPDFIPMMEDLIYIILDILLYHGEENAYDEIDIDTIHVQLEEIVRKFRPRLLSMEKLSHTFLVVSSSCHSFPWECLSFLKPLSITRIPSISILDDLLNKCNDGISPMVSSENKISMILNPHGDLSKTESRFSNLFKEIVKERPNSNLLINQKPDEKTFLEMATSSNLFIYLGHGGGEQYARVKEIKKFDRIAPTFLLGCSSASMKAFGKLEPTGTVYSYLLGGCPLVLGNLWDVTDKDIDKFSESVFNKIGLSCDASINSSPKHTISTAVSKSRDVCHLKYLNGAAPVVYGLPMRFR